MCLPQPRGIRRTYDHVESKYCYRHRKKTSTGIHRRLSMGLAAALILGLLIMVDIDVTGVSNNRRRQGRQLRCEAVHVVRY